MTDETPTKSSVEGREDREAAFVQFYRYVLGKGYERNVGGMERMLRYTLGALCTLAGPESSLSRPSEVYSRMRPSLWYCSSAGCT